MIVMIIIDKMMEMERKIALDYYRFQPWLVTNFMVGWVLVAWNWKECDGMEEAEYE